MSSGSGWMSLEGGRKRAWSLFRLGSGWVLTIVGLALLILPGPGILLLLPGLTLLSTESQWVRRQLRRVREYRHVRRAMREAEKAGFKIDPGPDDEPPASSGAPPGAAGPPDASTPKS
jgi:putative transmembrane protein PGPGW